MAKYNEKLIEKIVSLIEADTYSISEICSMLKISRKSFYEWKESKPEFKKAIDEAINHRDDNMVMLARNSLQKKLDGYILKEVRTTYVPDRYDPSQLKIKSKVVKEKEYAPDAAAIKLTLTREDRKQGIETEDNTDKIPFTIIVNNQETKEEILKLQRIISENKQKTTDIPKKKDEKAPCLEIREIEKVTKHKQ